MGSEGGLAKDHTFSGFFFCAPFPYIAFIHTEYRLNLFIEVDSEKSIKHRYERSATFVGLKGPVCILNLAGVQNDIKRTHCCQYFDVQALN